MKSVVGKHQSVDDANGGTNENDKFVGGVTAEIEVKRQLVGGRAKISNENSHRDGDTITIHGNAAGVYSVEDRLGHSPAVNWLDDVVIGIPSYRTPNVADTPRTRTRDDKTDVETLQEVQERSSNNGENNERQNQAAHAVANLNPTRPPSYKQNFTV